MAIEPLPPPHGDRGIRFELGLAVAVYLLAIALGIRALVSLW